MPRTTISGYGLVAIAIVAALGVWTVARGADDPDPDRFAAEIKRFVEWDQKNAWPAKPILFVGSSSIRLWQTREAFGDLPVINRGFGGSHLSDVNHYADEVVRPYDASVIVLYEGDNDVAGGKRAAQILGDFKEFVRIVREQQPKVPIVFLAIKPSPARWDMWSHMQAANTAIRSHCEFDPRLTYVDVARPLLGRDGKPVPEYYIEDGLHLSPAGYRVWRDTVAPILKRIYQP